MQKMSSNVQTENIDVVNPIWFKMPNFVNLLYAFKWEMVFWI